MEKNLYVSIKRGDIFIAELNVDIDHQGVVISRPVIVLSDINGDETNEEHITVVPIKSTKPKLKRAPYIQLDPNLYGLKSPDAVILPDRINTISKNRLKKKIARLTDNDLKRLENAILDIISETTLDKVKKESRVQVYKDFKITGEKSDLDHLSTYLKDDVNNSVWSRRDTKGLEDFLVFERIQYGNLPGALLFLHIKDNIMEITNVTPINANELNYDEYNNIIDEFSEQFVIPFIQTYSTKLIISSSAPSKSVDDFLSLEVANHLRIFSSAANKSTGSSHPLDKKRWFQFITASFNSKEIISTDFLQRWLIETEGWSKEIANGLTIEYEQAISLLEFYSESIKP